MIDPSEVLDLPPDPTPSEVRAAHRLAVAEAHRTLHPASPEWSDRMAALNVARDGALAAAREAPCRACRGSGRADGFVCAACGGSRRNR